MSYGTMLRDRAPEGRDITVATPEEFVKKFGGSFVIDRVSFCFSDKRNKDFLSFIC